MRLSTKGRYGVRLMLDLAQHFGEGHITLSDAAKRQGISEKYLEHLIAPLKKGKLISASRGSRGGYVLVRPPEEITLKEIITAVEGPLSIVECTRKPSICNRSKDCLSREVWNELSEKISETLSSVTLQKLVEKKSLRRLK